MTSVPATLDDSTLIKLTLAGRVEAFAALMDRHKAAVRRRIFAMVRSTGDTDDLLQEVQLQVWRHLSAFRSESTFRMWIIRVAISEMVQSSHIDHDSIVLNAGSMRIPRRRSLCLQHTKRVRRNDSSSR